MAPNSELQTVVPIVRKLSVVIPVYNEIATVRTALDAILAKVIAGWELEIIIVESNSNDGTLQAVTAYGEHPRVKLVLESAAKGKGHAVRAGFAHASGEVILIQDADLEYDVADYDALLAPIASGRQVFVLGSRHGRGGLAIRKYSDQPVRAMVLNTAHWGFTLLINAALGIWLNDPFTMYKVFRRDCLAGLSFESNRFDFDWELLIKLVRKGYRPIEIPVTYRSRSFKDGKKVRIWRDPFTWLRALVKFRFAKL
jgi:glycosyltransferase involved in cell wall biosynthesis